jgi:hypothetical protein
MPKVNGLFLTAKLLEINPKLNVIIMEWQKRGIGIYFMNYEKDDYNPITKQTVLRVRRKLSVNLELPRQNYEYSNLIAKLYDNMIVNSKIIERT